LRINFSLTTEGAVVLAQITINWPGNASAPTNSSRESGMRAAMLSIFLAASSAASSFAGAADWGSWAAAPLANVTDRPRASRQIVGEENFIPPI
jgi:hypothetical protein